MTADEAERAEMLNRRRQFMATSDGPATDRRDFHRCQGRRNLYGLSPFFCSLIVDMSQRAMIVDMSNKSHKLFPVYC